MRYGNPANKKERVIRDRVRANMLGSFFLPSFLYYYYFFLLLYLTLHYFNYYVGITRAHTRTHIYTTYDRKQNLVITVTNTYFLRGTSYILCVYKGYLHFMVFNGLCDKLCRRIGDIIFAHSRRKRTVEIKRRLCSPAPSWM